MGKSRSNKNHGKGKGKHATHEKIDSVIEELDCFVSGQCRMMNVSNGLFGKTKLHILGIESLCRFLEIRGINKEEGVKRLLHKGVLIEVSEKIFVLSSEVTKQRNISAR